MRRFVLGWKKLGLEQSLGTCLVTYADDLVILCRGGNAERALHYLREIMGKLKLSVNEEKTQICRVPDGEFDFLGYTFGRMYSPVTGKARLGYRPSKKSIKRMVERVHALTVRAATWQATTRVKHTAAAVRMVVVRGCRHRTTLALTLYPQSPTEMNTFISDSCRRKLCYAINKTQHADQFTRSSHEGAGQRHASFEHSNLQLGYGHT
jgi:hypothetical protein